MSDLQSMFLAALRGMLVEIATATDDGYITVADIQKRINILPNRGQQLADLLNSALWQIAEAEYELGHPMLTAILVKQEKGSNKITVGPGFFTCAKKLGLFNGSTDSEREQFWREQFDAVHEYWRIPRPRKS